MLLDLRGVMITVFISCQLVLKLFCSIFKSAGWSDFVTFETNSINQTRNLHILFSYYQALRTPKIIRK